MSHRLAFIALEQNINAFLTLFSVFISFFFLLSTLADDKRGNTDDGNDDGDDG